MGLQQREQFRDVVTAAMSEKSWSATRLNKESGVSQTTITKVMRCESVAPGTVGKLRKALGIEALESAQASEGYPLVIKVLQDAVGMVVIDMPTERWPKAAAAVIAALANLPRDD